MFYVSFEIETPLLDWSISRYRDKLLNVKYAFLKRQQVATKDGVWFFKIYDDISCGAEFVTLPIPIGETLDNVDVDNAADIVYTIMRGIKKTEGLRARQIKKHFGKISTHITFTNHPKRAKSMPAKLCKNAINNVIKFYYPILYYTATFTYPPLTRSSYFRRYYTSQYHYKEDKSDYPAVFVPSYNYNDLVPFHKIEFRFPDTLLLAKKKNIANLLDMYVKLMLKEYNIDYEPIDFLMDINKTVERMINEKGSVYNIDNDFTYTEPEKMVLEYFRGVFADMVFQ